LKGIFITGNEYCRFEADAELEELVTGATLVDGFEGLCLQEF